MFISFHLALPTVSLRRGQHDGAEQAHEERARELLAVPLRLQGPSCHGGPHRGRPQEVPRLPIHRQGPRGF